MLIQYGNHFLLLKLLKLRMKHAIIKTLKVPPKSISIPEQENHSSSFYYLPWFL